jgi:hypothetical protein
MVGMRQYAQPTHELRHRLVGTIIDSSRHAWIDTQEARVVSADLYLGRSGNTRHAKLNTSPGARVRTRSREALMPQMLPHRGAERNFTARGGLPPGLGGPCHHRPCRL